MFQLLNKSLVLRLGFTMATIIALAFGSMLGSVIVAETSEGQASAVNLAGSLRMQIYRIASELAKPSDTRDRHRQQVSRLVEAFGDRLLNPRLTGIVSNLSKSELNSAYQRVSDRWQNYFLPLLARYLDGDANLVGVQQEYLQHADAFVDVIDHMVSVIEHEAEKNIQLLRLIQLVALFLTLLVAFVTLYFMSSNTVSPLRQLLKCATAVRKGDFSKRVFFKSEDELGQLGYAFNLMAEDLSKMYAQLELRVQEQTKDLEHSNRSLTLLYKATRRLSETPLTGDVYRELLKDIEKMAGTGPGSICLGDNNNIPAFTLATTLNEQANQIPEYCGTAACERCFATGETHLIAPEPSSEGARELFSTPIRDMEQQYGVLLVQAPLHSPLQTWQTELLEALASHIAIALNIEKRASQVRLLALMEERSIIARELHDSLAQSLSYLKIQVARLDAKLESHPKTENIQLITAELREGLNSAYRQLRELLTTFRLGIDAEGLGATLAKTVQEFSRKSSIDIALKNNLGNCKLEPNEEIHVTQVVREALANVVRHSGASHASVNILSDSRGNVNLSIEDNGAGLTHSKVQASHYGVAIMTERARVLGGELDISELEKGGVKVTLSFLAGGMRKPEVLLRSEQGVKQA